ncbi:MAG: UDP-N-acetylmuramate dehydrogenase [Pseudomonadota bacterium]|nr:UDP-N-acetylmuramate dehydrogenase [Pseudomonadota bacterium]
MLNKNLKDFNSLKLEYSCDSFYEINDFEDIFHLSEKIREENKKFWILGEGTNVVIVDDLKGIVVKNNLSGISIDKNSVEAASGENWDYLVKVCLKENLYGFENLSGIPGSVGACPVQNIGAYGVEVSNFIEYIETINLIDGNVEVFNAHECKFGYRESIFKKLPNHFITKIKFSLSTIFKPNLSYESIPEKMEINSAEELRQIILNIRENRLINPEQEPNVGSFFKNPVVSKIQMENLLDDYPDLKFYFVKEDQYKISAAWLIEKIKMKGYQGKDCGVSKKHSLVLVNFSKKSENLINLSKKIKNVIRKKFNIELEYEPTFIS